MNVQLKFLLCGQYVQRGLFYRFDSNMSSKISFCHIYYEIF